MARLAGRIALITGASRGLGAALAVRFAEEGARLVLIARSVGGLEELDDRVKAAGSEATLVPLDLTDGAALDRLGPALAERFGRLDILVGNAAELGPLSPLGHVEPKTLERVMGLNALANQRLIRTLDPLLRAAEAASAVFVTCAQAHEARPFWGAHAASKAALEALVLAYAAEARRLPLRVNLFDPGPMRTRLRATAYPGEDPSRVPPPEDATAAVLDLVDANCPHHGEIVRLAARNN